MILEQETYNRYGYRSSDLKPKSNKPIVVTCDLCGNVRVVAKHNYRPHCKSCSYKCRKHGTHPNMKGENNPNWKGGKVKQVCKSCGAAFFTTHYLAKIGKGIFCSLSCWAKWKSEHEIGEDCHSWKGGEVERICEVCGEHFTVYPSVVRANMGRFCSRKCAGIGRKKTVLKGEANPAWR